MSRKNTSIRVAAGQMVAQNLSHADAAFDVIARLAAQARTAGAVLLVLPECTYPAYWLESAERYRQGVSLRTPAVLQRLSRIAAEHAMHVVCGLVEESGERLYNAAALFDPSGALLGMARKTFLWDCDNRWFVPGE